jgi:hypothetical protein
VYPGSLGRAVAEPGSEALLSGNGNAWECGAGMGVKQSQGPGCDSEALFPCL